jgi:hypothetical protein
MASTGPIGAPLPTERIVSPPRCTARRASADGAMAFARAIMTTDTYPKALHATRRRPRATGFAKGSGMIHPNMATMLGFVLTDGRTAAPRDAGPAAARRRPQLPPRHDRRRHVPQRHPVPAGQRHRSVRPRPTSNHGHRAGPAARAHASPPTAKAPRGS